MGLPALGRGETRGRTVASQPERPTACELGEPARGCIGVYPWFMKRGLIRPSRRCHLADSLAALGRVQLRQTGAARSQSPCLQPTSTVSSSSSTPDSNICRGRDPALVGSLRLGVVAAREPAAALTPGAGDLMSLAALVGDQLAGPAARRAGGTVGGVRGRAHRRADDIDPPRRPLGARSGPRPAGPAAATRESPCRR